MKTIKRIEENFRHLGNKVYIEFKHQIGVASDSRYVVEKAAENIKHFNNITAIELSGTIPGAVLPLNNVNSFIDTSASLIGSVSEIFDDYDN